MANHISNSISDSLAAMQARISNVRFARIETITDNVERITFDFDGVSHVGALRGRNRDLCIGFGDEADRVIALRVFLDGDAKADAQSMND